MNTALHEFQPVLQQFSSEQHSRCGSVKCLPVLSAGRRDEHLRSRVLNLSCFEYGDPVVGYEIFTIFTNQQFVEAARAESTTHRISEGVGGGDVVAQRAVTFDTLCVIEQRFVLRVHHGDRAADPCSCLKPA